MSNQKIKNIVISKVIDLIEEKKNLPWNKPWYIPPSMNLLSGRKYSGINAFITSLASSPYFISAKDVRDFDIRITKGKKSYPIVFYLNVIYKEDGKTITEKEFNALPQDKKDKCVKSFIMRYYNVFNLDDLEEDTLPTIIQKRIKKYTQSSYNPDIKCADSLINSLNLCIKEGRKAAYSPKKDQIIMPIKEYFKDSESYYETFFHEIGHWTGAENRMNREGIKDVCFGSGKYSFEELIAEMISSEICYNLGIKKEIDNSAAYIKGWLDVIGSDPNVLFKASKESTKSIDYINKIYPFVKN
jgi:antirestriction protein ArdC